MPPVHLFIRYLPGFKIGWLFYAAKIEASRISAVWRGSMAELARELPGLVRRLNEADARKAR